MDILIKFRHGLGDAAQLTSVLAHLRHYHPDWNVDVAALVGKHSAYQGLCRNVYVIDRDAIPSRYQRVFNLDWPECHTSYSGWPSTKVERCLLEVFGLTPIPDLCRYVIHPRAEALELAREYLLSICPGPRDDGRFPAVLIHYEGNTSGNQKNLPVEVVRMLCEDLLEAGFVPVILDWDRRSPLCDGQRVHNPHANHPMWGGTRTGDAEVLAALVELSSLMIGVDSGPLHVAGATTTPTIGVWTAHHPLHYFGHAQNTLHLVPPNHQELLRGDPTVGLAYFEANYRHRVYQHLYVELSSLAESLLTGEPLETLANRRFLSQLRSTSYDDTYYLEHREAGVDYLVFGQWQQEYGRWLVESLELKAKRLLDVGCACGSIFRGLAQAGAVAQGVDLSEYMIRLGRKKWPDMGDLLLVADAVNLHCFKDCQWDALHCAQVAEHWKPELVLHILRELRRVTMPEGLFFCTLDTEELVQRQGRKAEQEDPTHLCIRPMAWWHEQLALAGWQVCTEQYADRLRGHKESFLRRYDWDWFVAKKV